MKTYTVSSIKTMLGCSHYSSSKNSFSLEKGAILHSILENSNKYSKEYSIYRGKRTPYEFEHDFELYESIVDDVKDTFPDFFTNDWIKEVELDLVYNDKYLGEIQLSGIIDKVRITQEKITIVDWKSGVSRADKNNPMDMLQALIYTFLLAQKNQQVPIIEFFYVYIEQNHTINVLTQNTPETRKTMYRAIRMWIFATQFQQNSYKISQRCNYCDRLTTCPVVDKELNELEADVTRLTVDKIKFLKSIISKIYDSRKSELIEEMGNDKIKIMNYYYVNKKDLTAEEILSLIPDVLKIKKTEAEEFQKRGIDVVNKKIKALK